LIKKQFRLLVKKSYDKIKKKNESEKRDGSGEKKD
jgi:hypothetical protein